MKLYFHPMSTTSRIVWLFVSDAGIPVEEKIVDLFTGEHMKEPFAKLNPNKMVPVIDDDGFILTESATILRYLADKTNSPAYPKDLKARAKINETMDWFNSNLYRDYGYGLVYPQVFPAHKRPSDEFQKGVLAWAKERSAGWLKVLNDSIIGPKHRYLLGDNITIADYFGTGILTCGEVVGIDFKSYPNVRRWIDQMKARPSYEKVFGPFNGWVGSMKDKSFEIV